MTNSGIVLVELIELALLEENNSVPEFLLDLPVLLLERRESGPCERRDVDSSGIVVRVAFRVAVNVLEISKP